MHVHRGQYWTSADRSPRLGRFIRKESELLTARKEALDNEFPAHATHIPANRMRLLAYRSLLDRICSPSPGRTGEGSA